MRCPDLVTSRQAGYVRYFVMKLCTVRWQLQQNNFCKLLTLEIWKNIYHCFDNTYFVSRKYPIKKCWEGFYIVFSSTKIHVVFFVKDTPTKWTWDCTLHAKTLLKMVMHDFCHQLSSSMNSNLKKKPAKNKLLMKLRLL